MDLCMILHNKVEKKYTILRMSAKYKSMWTKQCTLYTYGIMLRDCSSIQVAGLKFRVRTQYRYNNAMVRPTVVKLFWVADRGGKYGFLKVFLVFKNQKTSKGRFFVFYVFLDLYFSYKFCDRTIIFIIILFPIYMNLHSL